MLCRPAAIATLVAGGTHFDLWLAHGYRSVHAIGPLFLLNAVSAAVIATLLLSAAGVLVQLVGLGYAVGTLAAFFISVYHGLFGFIEALNGTPQMIAALAEATAIALLALSLARARPITPNRGRGGTRTPRDWAASKTGGVMRRGLFRIYRYLPLVLAALIVAAALSGCGGKGGGY
jgi:hypothetical protein